MSPALPRGAATARRAACCAGSASPTTSRAPAARRRRMSISASRRTARVALITGTQTIGQGHETTFPQILADRLGLPNEAIRLVQGDTDLIPLGGGHGSSRATYMGGTAIWRASDEIIEKGTAHRRRGAGSGRGRHPLRRRPLSSSPAPTGRIALLEVAARARERGTPLDTYYAWTREWMTFPNGTHVAEVEIDRETGAVRLVRYGAVDDYGVLVNPMVAAGQAHGAIAQGIGQALLEADASTTRTSGQPLAGSLHGLRAAARRRPAAVRARLQRRRAAPPTRSASRAAARPARSPPSRRSATRSSTRWRRSASPISPARRPPSPYGGRCGAEPVQPSGWNRRSKSAALSSAAAPSCAANTPAASARLRSCNSSMRSSTVPWATSL